jgi:DNA repair ATPase RecN
MEPANGVKFVNIIEEETKKCLENYQKLEEVTDEISEKTSTIGDFVSSDKREIMARWTRRRYLPFEDYILREVEEQVETFENSVENSLVIAGDLGEMLKKYNEKHDKPYKLNTREETLKSLSGFSNKRDFAIRETTWEIIDNEPDLDILTMLNAYASLPDRDTGFWAWRKHIFETPALWTAMRDVFVKTAKY